MRNARMSGGNLGQGFRLGAEMLTRGYAVNEPYNTCGAMSRPGQLSTDATSTMGKGLPGLIGGGRKASRCIPRKSRKANRKGRKMRGGRYEAVLQGAEFEALGPRGGMMATAGTLPCERGAGAYVSPTESTLPARQAGGAAQLAPAPFLEEKTAGYTQEPSKWLDSVGAPIELRTPVGGQLPAAACKTTGGGKRKNMRGGDEEDLNEFGYSSNNPLGSISTNVFTSSSAPTGNVSAPAGNVPKPAENAITKPAENATMTVAPAATQGGRRSRKSRKASRKASRKNRKASRKASRKNRKASRKNRKH